jgi:hypothetical protein
VLSVHAAQLDHLDEIPPHAGGDRYGDVSAIGRSLLTGGGRANGATIAPGGLPLGGAMTHAVHRPFGGRCQVAARKEGSDA